MPLPKLPRTLRLSRNKSPMRKLRKTRLTPRLPQKLPPLLPPLLPPKKLRVLRLKPRQMRPQRLPKKLLKQLLPKLR